jgi:flagellar basal-body rod modification protein FlgD
MITPTTSTPNTAAGTSNENSMSKLSGNFSTFLTLLTSQLKNQDPTSPMDTNQFTQQLVMYSQVEQQIQGNSHLKTLIAQGQSSAAAVATGYLGKKVSITNGMASLSSSEAKWTYNLQSAAQSANLTVTDASGKVVYVGDAEKAAGNHAFTWDGKDNNGNQLADGVYKLSVTASDVAKNPVTTAVASAGTVSQIDMTGGTPQLIVGHMSMNLSDIAAVAN